MTFTVMHVNGENKSVIALDILAAIAQTGWPSSLVVGCVMFGQAWRAN